MVEARAARFGLIVESPIGTICILPMVADTIQSDEPAPFCPLVPISVAHSSSSDEVLWTTPRLLLATPTAAFDVLAELLRHHHRR